MPAQQMQARRPPARRGPKANGRKPELVLDGDDRDNDPSSWLGFTMPSRGPQTGLAGPPRRSRRGDAWKGSALTREKFVNASFRFMLKPTDVVGYGAHFADPDISLHWPNILQVLVPTFSAYSVAQGFVASDADDDDATGEEAAERRRRIEEERQGRSCPICLSKPVAGRMTKCGHIFCLPCILHYIALSDVPKATSCPICGDTIHEGMLKSVRYLDAETMVSAAAGDDSGGSGIQVAPEPEIATMMSEAQALDRSEAALVADPDAHRPGKKQHILHMRLLNRPQMTTLALPSTATWPSDAIPPISAPWHFLPDVLTYSRFALASPDYMMSELQRELGELKREWDALAGDDLGRAFIKAAREKVERQVGKVEAELMTDFVRRNEVEARRAWGEAVGGERREKERARERERRAAERAAKQEQDEKDAYVPLEMLSASAQNAYGNVTRVRVPPNVAVEPNPMPTLDGKNKRRQRWVAPTPPQATPATGPAACFYQSSLGAHVYLNALDMRILLTHFGSYDSLPPHISFPTTGYDSATVTEDLRKRTKYLSHLPIGTEVVFVEADLAGIVPGEVLAKFDQPLKTRRDKRRARTRREDRDKKRWEEAEKAKRPPEVHVVRSALAPTTLDADAELAMALERSRLDVSGGDVHFPSMDASPPRPTHAQPPPSPVSSFSAALRGPATARAWGQRQDVDGAGVDEAWASLNHEEEQPEIQLEEAGRKKKGNKKGKKLVFGGAGRQA